MDTDSVITDYNIAGDVEMNKKWIRSGGEKLGELTNETEEKGGYYTELVTLGNKMYALRNEKLNKNKIVLKMKGINIKAKYYEKNYDFEAKRIILSKANKWSGRKEVTFDDFILMSLGFNLRVDNMNFISGVKEVFIKKNGLVKLRNEKNIRSLYDKAIVGRMNSISPLIL